MIANVYYLKITLSNLAWLGSGSEASSSGAILMSPALVMQLQIHLCFTWIRTSDHNWASAIARISSCCYWVVESLHDLIIMTADQSYSKKYLNIHSMDWHQYVIRSSGMPCSLVRTSKSSPGWMTDFSSNWFARTFEHLNNRYLFTVLHDN